MLIRALTTFLCFLAFASAPLQANKMEFEGYIESWKQDSWNALQHLAIQSNTVVDIAFGNFTFTVDNAGDITAIGGLEMPLQEFNNFIAFVHGKGGKVKLSLGGATYPLCQYLRSAQDAPRLAQLIAKAITQFHLDGIDLDIEDSANSPHYYPEFPQNAVLMIQDLRQYAPANSLITLTVPGGAWFEPWQTIIPGAKGSVSFITFMEYNIWIEHGKTFVEQIMWDIGHYQTLWGLTPQQIQLGLMPGPDDLGQNLTLTDAGQLAEWAKDKGLSGVMIWSFNRDYEGQDGQPPGAYGIAIQGIIDKPAKHKGR